MKRHNKFTQHHRQASTLLYPNTTSAQVLPPLQIVNNQVEGRKAISSQFIIVPLFIQILNPSTFDKKKRYIISFHQANPFKSQFFNCRQRNITLKVTLMGFRGVKEVVFSHDSVLIRYLVKMFILLNFSFRITIL